MIQLDSIGKTYQMGSTQLVALADVYSARGEHGQAFEHYEEVVAIRTRLGDPLLLTDVVDADEDALGVAPLS